MSYRDDFSENVTRFRSRERREFEDEIARQEREVAYRPVREAEAQLQATARELHAIEKQAVLDGKTDPGFVIPDSVAGKRMSRDAAIAFNAREAETFRDTCEEFRQWNTPESRSAIAAYLSRQGVAIADSETFRRAFERLRDFGLLTEKPAEPEPTAQPEPQIDPEVQKRKEWESYHSDIVSVYGGRSYTAFDLDRLPADEFRKIAALCGDRRPTLGNAPLSE